MSDKPSDKPSWYSSTLSQLAIGSVACYLLIASYVAFVTKDLSGLKWAAEVFGAGYLAARANTGKGTVPTPPAPPTTEVK